MLQIGSSWSFEKEQKKETSMKLVLSSRFYDFSWLIFGWPNLCVFYFGDLTNLPLALTFCLDLTVRLPKATLDPTSGQILCSPLDEDSHPLDLRGLPLTCTFGVWEGWVLRRNIFFLIKSPSWSKLAENQFQDQIPNPLIHATITNFFSLITSFSLNLSANIFFQTQHPLKLPFFPHL